jgi:hypothetical protein
MLFDVPSVVQVIDVAPKTLPTWAQTIISFAGVAVCCYCAISEHHRKNKARHARRRVLFSTGSGTAPK